MLDLNARKAVEDRLLELYGGDPFAEVVREAEIHRGLHGPACGLFPAGPQVMRLVAAAVRATRPRRILDLGSGFGYSALWLASACPADARVVAIDRFDEHIAQAREFAYRFRLADRIHFVAGEVTDVLEEQTEPSDFIHDDAWFASPPPYLEHVLRLLRPGGTLTMPNWFLLEDAVTGQPRRDWSEFAGPLWAEFTQAYAERLSRERGLYVAWSIFPALAIATKGVG
jgi:predicted O-methyltransferase YrrM